MQRLQRVRQSGLAECGGAGEPIASRLAAVPARPRAVGAGDRRDRPRRAGTRHGSGARGRPLAAGRGRADRHRSARQHEDRTAPAGRADGPRGALPQCGRRHPFTRADRRSRPADRGGAQQPAELLGRGTGRRRVTADPHAGDLVPDRPAVRRGCGPRCVAADAPARHESARPGRTRTVRQPAAPDRRLGRRLEAAGQDAVLVFDDGLGGFLPLSEADLSCDPHTFAAAGIVPAPVQPDGAGRGHVRRQADPPRALPPLAPRRRRSRSR